MGLTSRSVSEFLRKLWEDRAFDAGVPEDIKSKVLVVYVFSLCKFLFLCNVDWASQVTAVHDSLNFYLFVDLTSHLRPVITKIYCATRIGRADQCESESARLGVHHWHHWLFIDLSDSYRHSFLTLIVVLLRSILYSYFKLPVTCLPVEGARIQEPKQERQSC